MKEKFISKKFRRESLEIIDHCISILEDYAQEGYDLTVRQLYYQLVASDLIENTVKSYTRIKNIINDARLVGFIDWDMIVDRGRKTIVEPHWSAPDEIIESAAQQFRIDRWQSQPIHLDVMCEKQALEGVLEPACSKWHIPFTSNKGYSSQSQLYITGKQIREIKSSGRDYHIFYFGDHDPSGLNMDEDVQNRLSMFGRDRSEQNTDILFHRLALTKDQIESFNPPPNPAKESDSRAAKYIKEHGPVSWELDALEPRTLVSVLDSWVENLLEDYGDVDRWRETEELENEMKEELQYLADKGTNSIKWSTRINKLFYDWR